MGTAWPRWCSVYTKMMKKVTKVVTKVVIKVAIKVVTKVVIKVVMEKTMWNLRSAITLDRLASLTSCRRTSMLG